MESVCDSYPENKNMTNERGELTTTLHMIFSVIYYLEIHNVISFCYYD